MDAMQQQQQPQPQAAVAARPPTPPSPAASSSSSVRALARRQCGSGEEQPPADAPPAPAHAPPWWRPALALPAVPTCSATLAGFGLGTIVGTAAAVAACGDAPLARAAGVAALVAGPTSLCVAAAIGAGVAAFNTARDEKELQWTSDDDDSETDDDETDDDDDDW